LILKTTIYDNKYATKEDIEQLEKQLEQYDRDVYLLGNFGVITGDGAIVPYNDAMECTTTQISDEGEIYIGVDCAGMGNDNTVAMVRKGAVQLPLGFELSKAEEKEVVDKLIEMIQDLQRRYSTHVTVNIDTTGVGFGVGSQMRTANLPNVTVNSIAFGGSAKENDRYFNIATELYFNVRDLVMTKNIRLLNEPETISELCTREYEIEPAKSRRKIEPKDRFKKRIKKSPDKADALCLAFYVPEDNNKIPSFGYWGE